MKMKIEINKLIKSFADNDWPASFLLTITNRKLDSKNTWKFKCQVFASKLGINCFVKLFCVFSIKMSER